VAPKLTSEISTATTATTMQDVTGTKVTAVAQQTTTSIVKSVSAETVLTWQRVTNVSRL